MKIGILIDTLAKGGTEEVAVASAIELTRRGHAVSLIAYHLPNDYSKRLELGGVRICTMPNAKLKRFLALRRFLKTEAFDVVHAMKAPAAIWGLASAGLEVKTRWWVGHHALTSESLLVRFLCYLMRPRISGWIVPSRAAAKTVEGSYWVPNAQIHVVPNPVDVARFQRRRSLVEAKQSWGVAGAEVIIGIVANLNPWKNHRMIFRVARHLKERGRRPVFLCAGRDHMNGMLQDEARRLGLAAQVRFLGPIPDIGTVYEACDLAAIASSQESFGLALAEAGAFGIACISTDNGGASEVILHGHSGLLVAPDDDVNMASAIERLIDDEPARRSLGATLQAKVAMELAPSAVGEKLLMCYTLKNRHVAENIECIT